MMQLNIERVVLEKLLHDAAAASRLIGHIDDNVGGAVVGPLADKVDEVVHTLSELLGDPTRIATWVPDAISVFPEELDHGNAPSVVPASELTVAGPRTRSRRREPQSRRRSIGKQALQVGPRTMVIALVVLGVVTAAVIGGAP